MNDDELSILQGKVTALTMLVEALWVGELIRSPDPARESQAIIDHVFKKDEEVRKKVGSSTYGLRISEFLTSLLDRALKRAQQVKEPPT